MGGHSLDFEAAIPDSLEKLSLTKEFPAQDIPWMEYKKAQVHILDGKSKQQSTQPQNITQIATTAKMTRHSKQT